MKYKKALFIGGNWFGKESFLFPANDNWTFWSYHSIVIPLKRTLKTEWIVCSDIRFPLTADKFSKSAMHLPSGRLTRRKVIENSADAFPYLPVRQRPANMWVTAKQIRAHGTKTLEEKSTEIDRKNEENLCVEL